MSKTSNNLITKPYFKKELKKELKALESRRDRKLDSKLTHLRHELKEDIHSDISAAIAGAKYEIISEIEEGNKKLRTDILGVVADFGFTLPKLYA